MFSVKYITEVNFKTSDIPHQETAHLPKVYVCIYMKTQESNKDVNHF